MGPLAERPKSFHDASWREAVWSAWQRDDRKDMNEACRLVWPVLFRSAKSQGLSDHEAEVIVQDVLLSVLCRHLDCRFTLVDLEWLVVDRGWDIG